MHKVYFVKMTLFHGFVSFVNKIILSLPHERVALT